MSLQHVCKWCREFKDEHRDIHNREMIPNDSKTSIEVLRDHCMLWYWHGKVCARWIPRMLTENHKRQRLLQAYGTNRMEFLDSFVTGDERWVHDSENETTIQSVETIRVDVAAEV
ncbi:hypothetical protein Trydic_g20787 [Trypoxylus dichotomus]